MTPVLIALAIAPGVAIAIFIYIRDRYEREPWRLLVKAFISGMLITFFAGMLEWTTESLIGNSASIWMAFIEAFLIVGLIEEGCKFYLLIRDIYHSEEFNEPFDGITYSVMISMGFATFENTFYVLRGGVEVAILRMITAVPAHATYGILMGFYVGLAKFRSRSEQLKRMGLIIAVIFHGAYDFFLMQSSYPMLKFGTLIVLIIGILLSIRGIQILSRISPFRNDGIIPVADNSLKNGDG